MAKRKERKKKLRVLGVNTPEPETWTLQGPKVPARVGVSSES